MNKNKLDIDFLTEYTREEYEELRTLYPEDGTEYIQWQKLPKLPQEGKVVITFNGEHPDYQIDCDELIFREDTLTGVEYTYWRSHYHWDMVNFDIHYWKYAPDDPPGNYGYNVGD